MNDDLLSLVEREVLGWPGTSSGPGRFGSVAFRYGRREIGHVHRDLIADLPVTQELRERLLSTGRAREATSATRWKVARTPRRSWRY
jgi:hypothetical protein